MLLGDFSAHLSSDFFVTVVLHSICDDNTFIRVKVFEIHFLFFFFLFFLFILSLFSFHFLH